MRSFAGILFFFACFFSSAQEQELQLVIPTGHTRPVQHIELSKDTSFLFSADFEPEIFVWDYQSGEKLYSLKGHKEKIQDMQFYNGHLWSADAAGLVKKWDSEKTGTIRDFPHARPVNFLAVDTLALYTATRQALYKWDLATNTIIDSLVLDTLEISALEVWDDRSLLLVGMASGQLLSLSMDDMRIIEIAPVSEKSINAIAVLDERAQLLTGDNRGNVALLDADLQVLERFQAMSYRIYDLKVLPGGGSFIAAGRNEASPVIQFTLDGFEQEDVTFDFGSASTAELAIGVRKILTSDGAGVIYTTPSGEIVQQRAGEVRFFTGAANAINSIKIFENDLFISSGKSPVRKIDLSGIKLAKNYPAAGQNIYSFDIDPSGSLIATVTAENRINLYDLNASKLLKTYEIDPRYRTTPVLFDPTGNYIIRKNDQKSIDIYQYKEDRTDRVKVENGFNFKFSKTGRLFFVQSEEGIVVFDVPGFKEKAVIAQEGILDFTLDDDKLLVLKKDHATLLQFDMSGNLSEKISLDDFYADRIRLHPDGTRLLAYRTSVGRQGGERDFNVQVIDLSTQKISGKLSGHTGFIRQLDFFREGRFAFTASADGTINIYDLSARENAAGKLVPLGEKDFVTITPSGLYDATPRAMKGLHYAQDGEILGIEQFKNSFFEPNLLPRLLGLNDEPLPEKGLSDVTPHPEVQIKHPNLNEGRLGISLEDRGGGIGNVIIIINGKEVARDARDVAAATGGALEFDYSIANHPYLKQDQLNKVTIKAYNADGSMSSSEKNIFVFPDGKSESKRPPRLYALVAGSSDYEGEQLDLKYAAKDAEDFAEALANSADNLFGPENVQISLLTTNAADKAAWPYKPNIDSVFTEFSKSATAADYLLIYLSGHGLNEGDFYYLTPEASDQNFDSSIDYTAISSTELTEMIKRVPALQQVMILDACHSGRFANELLQLNSTSSMDADKIKALEKIKDRTGLYVLAGSKADAVSYEASLFEQGLLTYSILFGMKGAALSGDEQVDVIDLFQFVAEKVPELAKEIGGVQKPELRYPNNATSFKIGKMNEEDKENIKIAQSKPVFVLSNFQEELSISDPLGVSKEMNEHLQRLADDEQEIIFVRKTSFSDAFSVWGRYSREEGLITASIKVYQNDHIISEFEETALNAALLADAIAGRLIRATKKDPGE